MTLGDKNSFAIEVRFKENDPKLGHGKLWFQNNYYGTIEDLIYIEGYLIGLVKSILNAPTPDFEYKTRTKKELLDKLREEAKENFDYKIASSTFTDDFEGYKFQDAGQLFVLWQLNSETEQLFEELKDYGNEIHYCSVTREEIQSVVDELKTIIKSR